MYSHVMVGSNDLDKSAAFYDATFKELGIAGQRHERAAFYGTPDKGMFAVCTPRNGEPATHANGGTIGFQAASPEHIDAWHKAGIATGGSDEGAPGRRDMGPQPLYGAYLRDPDGNKLCAFCPVNEGT